MTDSTDTLRPAPAPRPLVELRASGLLWLINRTVFHPRGFSLGLAFNDSGQPGGWHLFRSEDGGPGSFTTEADTVGFTRAEATLAAALDGPRLLVAEAAGEEQGEEVHPHPECPICSVSAGTCTATWRSPHAGPIRCGQEAGHYSSDLCLHLGRSADGIAMQWRDVDREATPHRPDTVRTPCPDTPGPGRTPVLGVPGGQSLTSPDTVRTPSPDTPARTARTAAQNTGPDTVRTASPQTPDTSRLAEITRLRARVGELEGALRDILGHFAVDTGRDTSALYTGLVDARTIGAWRSALASTGEQNWAYAIVHGICPACRHASLFLSSGGYVTCARAVCKSPNSATTVLEDPPWVGEACGRDDCTELLRNTLDLHTRAARAYDNLRADLTTAAKFINQQTRSGRFRAGHYSRARILNALAYWTRDPGPLAPGDEAETAARS